MPELTVLKSGRESGIDSEVINFTEKVLGANLWWMQQKILSSVFNERYTCVRSCHSIGKSYLAAVATLSFLLLHPNSIVVTTAPTWLQVKSIIWREIRKIYNRARINDFLGKGLGGVLNQTDLTFGPTWYSLGLSPKENEVERIQGFHSETGDILVICDESPGCSPEIVEAVENSLMTSPGAKFLQIGNPVSPSGHFYNAFKDAKYNKFHVPFSITPNAESGKDSVPYLITGIWVSDMLNRWGQNHPFYVNKVLAEFTTSDAKNIIPLEFIERAMMEEKPSNPPGKKGMGVDIAESGEDRSAIAYRNGNEITKIETYSHHDTMKICGWLVRKMNEFNPDNPKDIAVNLDTIGVGKGVYDRLRELGWSNVKSVRGSRSPLDREKFGNLKTEMWWNVREGLRDGEFLLPHDEDLKGELAAPEYELDSHGRITIERKKDVRKRLGFSPDLGDATILAYAKAIPNMRIFV